MIIWKHDSCGQITMVYGFSEDKPAYDVVLTLQHKTEATICHGFMSKIILTGNDYKDLFDYVKSITNKDIVMDVIPAAHVLYRHMFRGKGYSIIQETKATSFDGYEISRIRVSLK